MKNWELDNRVELYVVTTCQHGVSHLRNAKIDHALVTALVERWHQEAHTFHLSIGETVITLQDVAILLGLKIDGRPVTTYRTRD